MVVNTEKLIKAINERLKISCSGVQIQQQGNSLYLRASLPPKPSSDKGVHQQRISLSLLASPEGIKQAELEAKKLEIKLVERSFSWQDYLKIPIEEEKTTEGWIEAFKADYFSIKALNHHKL